jgi:type VI secretion system protein ImpE
MTARELLQAGRLSEARRVLVEEVKAAPKDTGRRTLLFQVLAQLGEWDKAVRHLDMISTQDPGRSVGVHAYLDIIKAEQERLRVIGRGQDPTFLPEPPQYFPTYLAYLDALKAGRFDEARGLLAEIDQVRPPLFGALNGRHFAGISDTDARLYAFLEAFVHERAVWIPFEAVREVVIPEPKTSFDLIWTSATITTWGGLSMNCFLPVVYPETFQGDDDQAKLGRLTDWVGLGGGFSRGVGQHVYQMGDEDVAILDIRELTFTITGG